MLEPEFRDILKSFNQAGVEYLVVGAYALAGHGLPRATMDLDLWIRRAPENATRVIKALAAFGAPRHVATRQDLLNPDMRVQVGVEPVRVDILMSISGVDFDSAYAARLTIAMGDVVMPILDREHLLANKRASGRTKDLVDVEWLEQHEG